jgi:hypothetical protein
MFGYLPAPCRCQIGDQVDVYRSAFCGLCNALARDYGQPARFLVNRDAAFVALLAAAQSPSPPALALSTRCQPWRKPMPVLDSGPGPAFAGAVTLCGLEAKLDDECADERGLRAAGCRVLSALSRSRFDRAQATLAASGFPVAEVRRRLNAQQRCEACILDHGSDPAEAAQPSAQAFGAILAHTARVAGAERNVEPLYVAGRYLGEMVYTLDAFQDLPDDQAHDRFNFLAAHAGSRQSDAAPAAQMAREIITTCQQQMRHAWQAVELPRYRPLLEAVLLVGMPARTARLLAAGGGPAMITEDAGTEEERQQAYGNDNCACFSPNGGCGDCCYCCNCCDCQECSSDGSGCCCDGSDGAGCCCDGGGDCGGCDCGGCDCNCSG